MASGQIEPKRLLLVRVITALQRFGHVDLW